jgi:hypothetical protein
VGVPILRADLGARHEKLEIGLGEDIIRFQGLGKAWPTCPGVIFIERAEQWLAGHYIHVDPGVLVVPVFVVKRRLGSLVLSYLILHPG